MKKLTKEEAAKAGIVKNGRTTSVTAHLMELEIGEALIIERGVDWKSKSPPYRVINYFSKKTGRKFNTGQTTDRKGWIALRIS